MVEEDSDAILSHFKEENPVSSQRSSKSFPIQISGVAFGNLVEILRDAREKLANLDDNEDPINSLEQIENSMNSALKLLATVVKENGLKEDRDSVSLGILPDDAEIDEEL